MRSTVVKLCQSSAAFRFSQLSGGSTKPSRGHVDGRIIDVKNRNIIYSYIYLKRYLSIQIYIYINTVFQSVQI